MQFLAVVSGKQAGFKSCSGGVLCENKTGMDSSLSGHYDHQPHGLFEFIYL